MAVTGGGWQCGTDPASGGTPPKQQHTGVLVFSYAISKYPNPTAQPKLKEKGTEQVFYMTQQEAVLLLSFILEMKKRKG